MTISIVFYIFDEFDKFLETLMLKENSSSDSVNDECCEFFMHNCPKTFAVVFKVDGYFLSVFSKLLNASSDYSRMVTDNFLKNSNYSSGDRKIRAKFQLVKPKLEVLDYAWNYRVCSLLGERQQLEHAMSWLSTLGGAFSALGDNFESCAKVAGKISLQQFRIAFQLCEPPLVARCRLYMALSLLQLGKLVKAKNLVQQQYILAKTLNDFKLQNMCKGVWAKLQYMHKQKKCKKKGIV